MHLTKLELVGFKSFAQKTTLVFDRGIASIVGPNGSGKSNIADAIRWVLGEQSIKLLRGKRSEDVIFSGSSMRARLGMAEVSLFLDNSDHQMPVDYNEVVVTRRVYRSGDGEYFLNRAAVRLQDIQLLLAKANFGQKSYSVIGQGMIDHILVASPAERKAFFDEAAGVRQYQIKREQAVNKLEQTHENLDQARMLLAEIEPHLRTLTRQVRRLERRGTLETELQKIQVQYFSRRWHDLAKRRKDQEVIAAEQSAKQKTQEAALAGLQHELAKLEKEKSRHELFQELQQHYSRVLEQKNAVMKEQAILEGSEELAAVKSGELNVVWLENRHRELMRSLSDLHDEISSLEAEATVKEKALAERQQHQDAVLRDLEKLEDQLEHLKNKTKERRGDPAALAADIRVLHEEFAAFKKQLLAADSERDWAKLKREISRFDERLASLLQQATETAAMTRAEEVLEMQEAIGAFFKSKDNLVNEIHDLARDVERRRERLAMLHESKKRFDDERARTERELERLAPKSGKARTTAAQRQKLDEQIRQFDTELQALREQIVGFNQEEQKKKERLFELQKSFREKQQDLNALAADANATRVELAKLETRQDDLKNEVRHELPAGMADEVTRLTADDTIPESEPEEKLLAEINQTKHQLELIGGIDEGVTTEHKMTEERFTFLSSQVTDMENSISKLHEVISELDTTIKSQFHHSFQAINKEFGQYFKVLFEGGSAKLVLQETEIVHDIDEENDDEDGHGDEEEDEAPKETKAVASKKHEKIIAGVEIIATPPGKRVAGIAMLSGGEKALTSIALISAILSTRPSPFVVLDEVDAALDEANSQRFAAILKQLAKRSQFITITHNRATMQISSLLYGVTMSDDGISKLLSIRMEDAESVIKQHGNR
ncbi:MAG: AAA family ATPase [Candidatus Kerfeldbacteria bacterium]|nr:AAA family ATPase [Candidatus Kerfeldbacteria bacterium]